MRPSSQPLCAHRGGGRNGQISRRRGDVGLLVARDVRHWDLGDLLLAKKRNVSSPNIVLPFLGNAISLVTKPVRFWEVQADLATSLGFSVNYIIGRFIVFIRSTEISHYIFANLRPDSFLLVGHPFARDINLETSQTIFVGKYLSREARDKFRDDYNLFSTGLTKLLFDFPSFTFRNARLAVERLVEIFNDCATQSKKRMFEGDEPSCLIDFWMQETVREIAESKTVLPYSSDVKIDSYPFYFLFAAQDASSSSLLWAVTLLDSHLDVLQRVREEVSRIGSSKSDILISAEQLREMKYTQAMTHEVIRYRPPATLVPHIAMKDFLFAESYTILKGTILFLSVYDHPSKDRFEPERFSDDRQEEVIFKRNYLAFGAGPHQCVGQRYALNHLVLFIAMFVTVLDFKRHRTDSCDEIMYCPTICPKDGCSVSLSRRCSRYPNLTLN
ncbi:hypothetical protein J1N35_031217 [Gossypium stocksii]|uniref:C-22 sterol desaturase n=1 Tax=Gossypium stocksii TaxID=47602 RepID=A0A9D3V1I1_9ROSI|nr:hypothetical protein J1N35_031217 [Gossypium stocksii]